MSKMRIQTCYAILVATVLLLSASSSKAEVFTTVRFTRIGGSDQVIAVPTTFYLVPRYRPRESRSEPETWQVRLRNRNGSFTRSYQVGNSGLAIQRARRAHPDASILAVRQLHEMLSESNEITLRCIAGQPKFADIDLAGMRVRGSRP